MYSPRAHQATVRTHRAIAIPFPAPPLGAVRIAVQADGPVNVYALDAAGRDQYTQGAEHFQSLAQSTRNSQHTLAFSMPLKPWFLLVENLSSDREVHVSYAVETAVGGARAPAFGVGGMAPGALFNPSPSGPTIPRPCGRRGEGRTIGVVAICPEWYLLGYMATARQTTIRLADEDLAILDAIQERTGLFSRSDALRFALRQYAKSEGIEPSKQKRRRAR